MDIHRTFIDVTRLGAIGDGRTLCTAAIQAAIDQAAGAGGGVVHLPAGTFLSGSLELRSGVTLDIHPAGRLLGSPRLEDYAARSWGAHIDRTPWHLLAAYDARDIGLTGGGTIDGNGPAFWEPVVAGPGAAESVPPGAFGGLDALTVVPARAEDPAKARLSWIVARKESRPSPMIELSRCRNVRISDVRIVNSAGWLLHLHDCDHVWIRGARLLSNPMGPNNDGFDLTGCHDVLISDCHISCCDDAICLKTTPDSRTCERITVSNCILRTRCVALKFGCVESYHDFRQVTFSNCVVYESSRAVAMYTIAGGDIEDVTISNIVCDTRNPFMGNRPIHLCSERRGGSELQRGGVEPRRAGRISNVLISNVVCRTDGRILLTAQPESPMRNIVLRDVAMAYPTIDDPALIRLEMPCGQFARFNPEARRARGVVVAQNIEGLVLDNLMVTWPEVDSEGLVRCPAEWRFPLKACNGGFDVFYERGQFNSDRIPDFALLWARGVRGGYVRCPLSRPPREDLPRLDLGDCALAEL